MHYAGLKVVVFFNDWHDHPDVTIAFFVMTGNPFFFFSFALLFFCLSPIVDDSSRASSDWKASRALAYSRASMADEQATPRARDAFECRGGSSRRSTVDIVIVVVVVVVGVGDATEGRCEIAAAVIPTGGGVPADALPPLTHASGRRRRCASHGISALPPQ